MKLYSTYIETDKFDEVVNFYEKVFEKKGNVYTKNRWIEFDFGNKLSIYNRLYDAEKIKNDDLKDCYNGEYIKNFNIDRGEKKNNIVTFNFYMSNLKEEYNRIKELNLCYCFQNSNKKNKKFNILAQQRTPIKGHFFK